MMQPMVTDAELKALAELSLDRKWLAATALLIGLVVRVLKSDIKLTPTIPSRWRPWLAIGLGVVAGVLDAMVRGTMWKKAIAEGVVAAVMAMVGHDLFIAGLRGGRELGQPKDSTVPRGTVEETKDEDDPPPPPAPMAA